MKQWLIEVSRDDDSEAPNWRDLIAADTFTDALADALAVVLVDMVAGDVEEHLDAIRAVANQLGEPAPATKVGHGSGRLIPLRIKEDQDDDEPVLFLVWHDAPDRPGDPPNIGVGPGYYEDGAYKLAGKAENRWLRLSEWDGNPKRRQELASWSKDELIDRLVRLEAL